MKLNVNYKETNRIGCSVENKAVELNRRINELVVLIESVNDWWSGVDSANFINKSTSYLKERKAEVNEIKRVAGLIKRSSSLYGNEDVTWKEVITKEEEEITNA